MVRFVVTAHIDNSVPYVLQGSMLAYICNVEFRNWMGLVLVIYCRILRNNSLRGPLLDYYL